MQKKKWKSNRNLRQTVVWNSQSHAVNLKSPVIQRALQNHHPKLHLAAGLFRRSAAVYSLGGAVSEDFQRTRDIQTFGSSGSAPFRGTQDVQCFGRTGAVAFRTGISHHDLLRGCKRQRDKSLAVGCQDNPRGTCEDV